jgi:hypothetical protein
MKRAKPLRQTGAKSLDVLRNFTDDQLIGIGSVAMTYNEAESILHDLMSECIRYPGDPYEIVSRINGTEGIVKIVSLAAPQMGIDQKEVAATLKEQGFSHLKPYRDAVIHARIYDAASGVARVPPKHGKRLDILLTVPALKWLTEQFEILSQEMKALLDAFEYAGRLSRVPKPSGQHRARLEESLQESMARCRTHRTARLSLKPPPKFPEEPPILQWSLPPEKWRDF